MFPMRTVIGAVKIAVKAFKEDTWNLDEIIDQMARIADWGGKFVIPIPEATVIDPKEAAVAS